MATKAMNFKTDEVRIADIKSVASVFRMTITDVVNEALDEYLAKTMATAIPSNKKPKIG